MPRPCSVSASPIRLRGTALYSADILRRIDLQRIRAEGYGFQIEMTYRARQQGARITEVPISFVDREAGESKMSSIIVVEALGLVTWWGLGRIVHGVRRGKTETAPAPASGGQIPSGQPRAGNPVGTA